MDKGDPSAGHIILKEGGREKNGGRSKFFWIEASTMGDWRLDILTHTHNYEVRGRSTRGNDMLIFCIPIEVGSHQAVLIY